LHFGLIISILLHVAILGWSLLSFQSQRELRAPEPEAVAVGMIAPSEVTKVRLGSATAKQLESEAKESPKGEPATALPPPVEPPAPKAEQKLDPIAQKLAEAPPPPPPPPPPAAANPAPAASPPPAAAPDEQKDAEAAQAKAQREAEQQRLAEETRKAEEQKRAEEQKQAEEQKKAEEQKRLEEQRRQAELKKKKDDEKKKRDAELKKKRDEEKKRQEAEAAKKKQKSFDEHMRELALLNKVPDKGAPPPPSAPPTEPTKAKGPALGAPEGRDKQLSASEIAMLKGRIQARLKACWRLPSGGGGSDTPAVTLRWRLKPDGSLDGEPQVEQPRSDPLFRLAAEAALRAVRECSPFDLPPERYNIWRVITWDFDPSQML
jgi:colicin import membrane protein